MTRSRRVRSGCAAAVASVLVAALVAACGIETQDSAEIADDGRVPYELIESATTTTAPTPVGTDVSLTFVGGDGLLRTILRRVDANPSLTEIVAQLSEPPPDVGLRTALDEELVGEVDLQGGIAHVELAPEFASVPLSDQVLALGQIVYTLTAQPGVGRVSFELDGRPVPIPRGDGVITTESVSRDAYANLAAP